MSVMLTPETKISPKYSIPLFLALITMGLAGNYFRYPIFLNIDYLFGSIFAMLVLQFFGLGRGLVAAVLIASYTYVLWNHPYAIVIQTAEVLAVGWLFKRRNFGLVMADVLFWLVIGMPLVYLFYSVVMHTPPTNVYLTMTKQAINGIANALLARLIFYGFAFRTRKILISYREITYNLLAFFVLFPSLTLLMIGSRTDFAETDRRIKSLLIENVEHEGLILNDWASSRKQVVVNLAEMAATDSPQQMNIHFEQATKADSNFFRIAQLNRDASAVAYYPTIDEIGQSNIGKSYADRPYLPVLKQNLKPLLSEVSLSKVGNPKPGVAQAAPIIVNGKYSGAIVGILNLDRIKNHLDKSMKVNNTFYTLLDKNGLVIMTNRTDQKVMSPFNRGKGELSKLDNRVSQWVPPIPANTPNSERWKKSFYVTEVGIGALDEWQLILEQPVAPFQKAIFDNYTGKLFQLFIILLGALALAEFLSRQFLTTQERLQQITRGLPNQIAMGTSIDWPESGIEETSQLIFNFKETSDSLASQFYEIKQINESLENRVHERTAELHASKYEMEEAQLLAGTGSWIYDPLTNTTEWSRGMFNILGRDYSAGSFPVFELRKYIHPEDYPVVKAALEKAVEQGVPYTLELRIIRPDSSERIINSICDPIRNSDGKVVKLRGTYQDITERKQSEKLLRLTRFSVEHSSDGIFWMSSDARIVDVNEAACKSLRYSREELMQLTVADIDPFYNFDIFQKSLDNLRRDGSLTFETIHIRKDGIQFPVEIVANCLQFDTEERICSFVRNISERKQQEEERLAMEQHFQQSQRLESLGVLAGGIAHDFNNILAIIMGNCALAKMAPKSIETNLTAIEKASERAAALCRQMLEYAGHTQIAKSKVDMESLVMDMVEMLSSTGRKNVTIKPVVTPSIPKIYGDISQIRQITMNLIVNAIEAIGGAQGEIDVMLTKTVFNGEQAEKDYLGRVIPSGKYVCLEVTDDGCGMNEETKQKIFEPFYTTKFTGRGLGLSATLGIISGHDGALQLFSQLGKGTTFKVYLPAQTSDSTGDDKQEPTVSVPWQGSGTILLVEDEEQVRSIAKTILKKFGFAVIEAVNGKEALDLFQQNIDKTSLVITDIGMPVMDGYELFSELKKIKPEVPIIISSGFGDKDIGSKISQKDMAGVLSKPFNPTQLQEILKRVLDDTLHTDV